MNLPSLRFFATLLQLSCKRRLLRPAMAVGLVVLLLLSVCSALLLPAPSPPSAEIGLLFDPSDAALAEACAPLLEDDGLAFRAYLPGEEESMRRAVLTGELHCGYRLIPTASPPLVVYATEGSFLRPIAEELLFGVLFSLEAKGLIEGLAREARLPLLAVEESAIVPMRPQISVLGGIAPEALSLLDLTAPLLAILTALFLLNAWFGGLYSKQELSPFALLEPIRPRAQRLALVADATAATLLEWLSLLLALALPLCLGAISSLPKASSLLLLGGIAALLRALAARLAAQAPRAVPPLLVLGLVWCFVAVLCSGALFDPSLLGGLGTLRFLSPYWWISL